MEAGKKTIKDIFNGNRVLTVPFFQRAYVWDEPQWERLLEDMVAVCEEKQPYFLGSLILKQERTPTGANIGDKRILIDGQQRLTTLNILIKVLCLKLDKNSSFEHIFRLPLNDNQLALEHNRNDIKDFERVLNLTQEETQQGESQIIKAYNYFCKHIDPSKLDIQSILKHIVFVSIDLDSTENEQQIFDTINSLGIRLTTAELLKNYFFGRKEVDKYEKYWFPTFEADEDVLKFWNKGVTTGRSVRANIDLFFYSFLQIKIHDPSLGVKPKDREAFSKVEGLFESYKNFIEKYHIDKDELIKEIQEYANIYRDNIGPDILDKSLSSDYSIERINAIVFGIEHSTLIPYVLYILRQVTDSNERNLIWGYLEAYIMRRIICKMTAKNYNQLFTDRLIGNGISTLQGLKNLIETQADQVNGIPSDEDVKQCFSTSSLSNKQAIGILYLMESRMRDQKDATSLLGLKKYSLEHLMPKKWRNNWGDLETEDQGLERDRILRTLGNLTIIPQPLNSSISDAAWKQKLDGRGSRSKGLKEYSSGIKTLSTALNLTQWNEATIKERSLFLADKALEIWKTDI